MLVSLLLLFIQEVDCFLWFVGPFETRQSLSKVDGARLLSSFLVCSLSFAGRYQAFLSSSTLILVIWISVSQNSGQKNFCQMHHPQSQYLHRSQILLFSALLFAYTVQRFAPYEQALPTGVCFLR